MVEIIKRHLPDFCYKRTNRTIEGIVIHYYSAVNADPENWDDPDRNWELFNDLNRAENDRQYGPWQDMIPNRLYASADYLILRDGKVIELIPRQYKSWHAGSSIFKGRSNCNNWMTGYEILAAPQVNESMGYTDAQYEAAAELARSDMQEYGFGADMIVGHDEIRRNWNEAQTDATKRSAVKHDPGPTWDWNRFRNLL